MRARFYLAYLGLSAALVAVAAGPLEPAGEKAEARAGQRPYAVVEFYQWTDPIVDKVFFSRVEFVGGKLVVNQTTWNLLMSKEVPDTRPGDIVEVSFVTTISSYQYKKAEGEMKSSYVPLFLTVSTEQQQNTYDRNNAITTKLGGKFIYPASGENTNHYRPHERIWHHGIHRVTTTPTYLNAWVSPSSNGAGPNDYLQVFKDTVGNTTLMTVKHWRKF